MPNVGDDVPVPVEVAAPKPKAGTRGRRNKYIPRREFLKRTFGVDIPRATRVSWLPGGSAAYRACEDRICDQENKGGDGSVPRGPEARVRAFASIRGRWPGGWRTQRLVKPTATSANPCQADGAAPGGGRFSTGNGRPGD